ncbi:hypothetical protein [Streptomyces sp. HPF1205]|uniref:hypothetical protein n=1 Tax=Streptomyces sp. HPF1205 TaxID=2873262 RepID=UPI001CECA9B7|nr:hypothetical protein [Streptomyces sp. HPF1205]
MAPCLAVLGLTLSLHLTGHLGPLWTVLPVEAAYGVAVAAASLWFTAPRLPEILAVVAAS